MKKKIDAAGMPKDARDKAVQELKNLSHAADVGGIYGLTQLSGLAAWWCRERLKEIRNISRAPKRFSTEDHYGLEKIKELRQPDRT